ncbi:hypothetical protein QAD02_013334 [Eretmocerus hayati]|uniref:Uncharacterized protein n=1 Tax=Eretmocerus hayati TaxID=131215 RepID=A0ACC2P530_9HYME|nr:hypothetical protein QAD02_013334 [Eretmocerus hayati]
MATCEYNPSNPLNSYQRHVHESTCYKGRKNKLKSCRFNIPNFVMRETLILFSLKNGEENRSSHAKNLDKMKDMMEQFFQNNIVMDYQEMLKNLDSSHEEYILAIRSSLKHAKLFLKRKNDEVAINAYNKIILALLESNMDIQFVTNIYSCITYIVKYVTKIDFGMTKMLRETANGAQDGNTDSTRRLRKIANKFLNSNVMTAQKAVYHCLSLSLVQSSRDDVFVNTLPAKDRVRMLRSLKHMKNLHDDSEDIYYENVFRSYEKRNRVFEDCCLAESVTEHKITKLKKFDEEYEINEDDFGNQKRGKLKILRYRRYKLMKIGLITTEN